MTTENPVRALLREPAAIIMGIINTTPDSFSDGGKFNSHQSALEHARRLIEQGADILDIGGESTRPGAEAVSLQQELDRVIPVLESIRAESAIAISIDTYKPEVMREAVAVGASMINDVQGLSANGALNAAAEAGVPVCLMHMAGTPKTMQAKPVYNDVVQQVVSFLIERKNDCIAAGVAASDIILDPGIGFGKSLSHNLALLKNVAHIRTHTACELLIGVSRKSMIDALLNKPVDQRLYASVGLAVQAVLNGAKIVRVHDVEASFDAIRSVEAVKNNQSE